MNKWELYQYKDIVNSFLACCNEEMKENLLQRLDLLSDKGNECERPVSAPLGDGLFELRGRAKKERARLIYYFAPNRKIIFVYAFYKTSRSINQHDKKIAKRNKKVIEEGKEEAHGIDLTH